MVRPGFHITWPPTCWGLIAVLGQTRRTPGRAHREVWGQACGQVSESVGGGRSSVQMLRAVDPPHEYSLSTYQD